MKQKGSNNKILLIGVTPPPMGGIARYCELIMDSKLVYEFKIEFFNITVPIKYRPAAYTHFTNKNIFIRDGLLNVLKQLIFHWNNLGKFYSKIRTKEYRIVHIISCTGLGFWKNCLIAYLSKRNKTKVIFHIVGEIDQYYLNSSKIIKSAISFMLDMVEIIILQSEGLKNKVKEFTHTEIISIYNGIETEKIKLFKPSNFTSDENCEFKLITVGALGRRKGYFDLIEAARIIQKEKKKIVLFFVGGGEVEEFQQLVNSYKLQDIVKILGALDDDKKDIYLSTSDVFILPTYNEGQPIAILEAMAFGLPIISTSVGSIPEVVTPECGRLINPGDLQGMLEAINFYYENRKLSKEIGRNNHLKAMNLYSFKRVVSELSGVYSKLQN